MTYEVAGRGRDDQTQGVGKNITERHGRRANRAAAACPHGPEKKGLIEAVQAGEGGRGGVGRAGAAPL